MTSLSPRWAALLPTAVFVTLLALQPFGASETARADDDEGQPPAGESRRPTWDETIEAIAKSDKYGGLRILEQKRLEPLGPDPVSGLFEFAVEGTGTVPKRVAETGRLNPTNDFAIVLVLIPGGTFWMGAQKDDPEKPNYDPDAEGSASPVHQVALLPVLLAKYECTQAQWAAMGGGDASGRGSESMPVDGVSWDDCERTLGKHGLVLPSEAQWEYACRAGTTTPYWAGAGEEDLARVGWYEGNSEDRAHPVGEKPANAFGLHDMHGNMWEWCADAWHATYEGAPADGSAWETSGRCPHVLRDGPWDAPGAGSAARTGADHWERDSGLGCRPAMAVSPLPEKAE